MIDLKEFKKDEIRIVFYKKNQNSQKYRWFIYDKPELTKILLKDLNQKKFLSDELSEVSEKIFKIIQLFKKTNNINPMIELSQYCQIHLKGNIETCVSIFGGTGHEPIIKADLILPNGDIFSAKGKNKKEAKQKAAIEALKAYKN
jgi:dsRNA-specific ribonuclease